MLQILRVTHATSVLQLTPPTVPARPTVSNWTDGNSSWSGMGYFPSFPATSPYVTAVGATMGTSHVVLVARKRNKSARYPSPIYIMYILTWHHMCAIFVGYNV